MYSLVPGCATQLLCNGYLCGVCPGSGSSKGSAPTTARCTVMTMQRRTCSWPHHSAGRVVASAEGRGAATSGWIVQPQRPVY